MVKLRLIRVNLYVLFVRVKYIILQQYVIIFHRLFLFYIFKRSALEPMAIGVHNFCALDNWYFGRELRHDIYIINGSCTPCLHHPLGFKWHANKDIYFKMISTFYRFIAISESL